MSEPTDFQHGVGRWPGDGRWTAFCRYHGLRSAGNDEHEAAVRSAWAQHLATECIVPTIENRSATVVDHKGNLTGYMVPIDLWREVRASLQPADLQIPTTHEQEAAK